MSTILSLVFSKLGLYALAAIALLAIGAWLHYHWVHGDAPKQYTQVLQVAAAENGATLTAKAGILGRATQPVFVAGIAAPGLNDPLGPQSRDNLAALAGDTIRVVMDKPGLLAGRQPLVGQVFGATGADVALAQLRAGLAKCESNATKEQIAAQKEAQRAQRGLWAAAGGSHWWHFGIAAEDFPEPIPLVPESHSMDLQTIANLVMIAPAAIVIIILFWTYIGAPLWAKTTTGSAVNTAVDVTEQIAAYTALSAVRNVPAVSANAQAVAACELLLGVVMTWPKSAAAASTVTKSAG